jgi:Glyoxalase/Bleomycin resistance protein/Dioxygenase superfamily
MKTPSLRNHFQLGYVVRDIDKAIINLRIKFGVEHWRVLEMPPEAPLKSLAFAYVQDMLLELIEPRPGQEMFYKPWIPEVEHAIRLNHLGYMLDNEEEWSRITAQFAAAGFEEAISGDFYGVRFIYYDTVAELGHYCELNYLAPEAKGFFDAPRN